MLYRLAGNVIGALILGCAVLLLLSATAFLVGSMIGAC